MMATGPAGTAEPTEVCARCGHIRPWHSWVYAKNLGFHKFEDVAPGATPEWRSHTATVPNPNGPGYLVYTCEPNCGLTPSSVPQEGAKP